MFYIEKKQDGDILHQNGRDIRIEDGKVFLRRKVALGHPEENKTTGVLQIDDVKLYTFEDGSQVMTKRDIY